MAQVSLFDMELHWTVSELTSRVRGLLETAPELRNVWVQGEVSNLSRPASGHVYFTLKDAGAALRCVMWKGEARRQKTVFQDGLFIEAYGSVSVYEAGGQYQLYVDRIQPVGEGALYAEFLRLKGMLEAEGLFDAARKRALPEVIRRIGIVTSASGAALQDMLNTLGRRNPLAEVMLAASPVQGSEAPAALRAALAALNRQAVVDVILLARGGGSMEDLWAFNDAGVVRAIAQSDIPVITGVGHETDFTLADFAADLRAPTPTAAAELASPVTAADLRLGLRETRQILTALQLERISGARTRVESLRNRLGSRSPLRRVQSERQRVDELSRRGLLAQEHLLALAGARLKGLHERLMALNPLAVLGRGYAMVTKGGEVVRRRGQVAAGDGIHVRVQEGEFDARVSGGQVNYGKN